MKNSLIINQLAHLSLPGDVGKQAYHHGRSIPVAGRGHDRDAPSWIIHPRHKDGIGWNVEDSVDVQLRTDDFLQVLENIFEMI